MYIVMVSGEVVGVSYGPCPPIGLFDIRNKDLVFKLVEYLNKIDPYGELINTIEGPIGGYRT
jgi:hypothetical protein